MAAGLRGQVVNGFAWNVAEKIGSALFQAWVTINVTNRILPDEGAMRAILVAFVAIFNTFVDSGFSQALIRDRTATQRDYSSAFWFNMAMSVAIYGLLVGLSYPSARFFDKPDLVRFAPVMFLVVPLGALGIMQQTVMTRDFEFRRMSIITFASTVGSGAVAVTLAFCGAGFWAVVALRVTAILFRTALMWIFGRWKPSWTFSAGSIGRMFGFSSRLLGTDLLNNIYESVPQMIIGRIHSSTLGHYDNARQIRDYPVKSAMTSMQTVIFPALASIREDGEKFVRAVGRVVGAAVFVMFPIMAGLVVVADDVFRVFLAPQWQPSVPFFRILCLAGLVTPLSIVSSNILRTRSDGRDVLRAEVVKKVVATLILVATVPLGAEAIVWGVVGIAFSDAGVSFTLARRQSAYGFRALARDVGPVLGLTAAMAAAVWLMRGPVADAMSALLAGTAFGSAKMIAATVLVAKMTLGAAVYALGALALRLEAMREFTDIVRRFVAKVRERI